MIFTMGYVTDFCESNKQSVTQFIRHYWPIKPTPRLAIIDVMSFTVIVPIIVLIIVTFFTYVLCFIITFSLLYII